MNKLLSLYKWFDGLILSFSILGAIGSIASIYGLWYTITNKLFPPMIYAALFVLTIIFVVALYIAELYKFKATRAKSLAEFCRASHDMCHETRDLFFDMFDRFQAKKEIEYNGIRKTLADNCVQRLSKGIHNATGASVEASVTLFANNHVHETVLKEDRINRADLRNIINTKKIQLKTISVSVNGYQYDRRYEMLEIDKHTMLSYAIADIVFDNEGKFLISDTEEFIKKVLNQKEMGAIFSHPKGNIYINRNNRSNKLKLYLENGNGEEWFKKEKGVIIVPISNEKHLQNDIKNTLIYGFIKVAVDSDIVFGVSHDQVAYVNIIKGFGDTMFKCFERLDHYEKKNQTNN